jgi:hypothetical protein
MLMPASVGVLEGRDARAGEMMVGRAGRGECLAGAGFLLIGGSFVSSSSPPLFEGLRDVVMMRIALNDFFVSKFAENVLCIYAAQYRHAGLCF